MRNSSSIPKPAILLSEYLGLFVDTTLPGPVLDLACGDGQNGIFLASNGLSVVCCDRSAEKLDQAKRLAAEQDVNIEFWQVDLEKGEVNPLPEDFYRGIIVFRYLHRPLIPCIRKALKTGGILVYETFTIEQPKFGRPHNLDFLLKPEDLRGWFQDWGIIYYFEGIKDNPKRAVAQIVCRKT